MSRGAPRWIAELGAAIAAPAAALRAPPRAWRLALVYLLAASALLGVAGWAVTTWWQPAREWVLASIVPPSWRFAVRWLADRLLADRERLLAASAIATTGLMLVTVALFPLKEAVSRAFEVDGRLLADRPIDEPPWWKQGWQELELFAVFVAVQASLFWPALWGGGAARLAAIGGALFLVFSYALDFTSPILQRHRASTGKLYKVLGRTPLAALAFGALFAAPPWLASRAWAAHPEWSPTRAVLLVFGATVLGIAWAALAGTWFGARLVPRLARTPRPRRATRVAAWLAIVGLLVANAWGYAALVRAVRAKAPILQCDYDVDPRSIRVDTSSLAALLDDEARLTLRLDVTIHNPTELDAALEDSRLELRHRGALVASARVRPVRVAAGATVTETIAVDAALTPSLLGRGRELFRIDELSLTLWVRIDRHLEIPLRLLP